MNKLFCKICFVLSLAFTLIACGTGPALEEKTASDASVNVAAGAVDIDVNTGFTLEFSVAANATSVNTSTFFVVPAVTASISSESISAKTAINTSICNPANAITGTITPSTAGSCATNYTLNPSSSLDYETEYALCVTSGISFCNPNVNGFFSGLMETFTTVAEGTTYTVGGTITGLSGTVVLQNNASDDLTITENGNFTFSTAKTDGAEYDVTVKTNPDAQTCTASSNSGTIDGTNITDVVVTCSTNAHTIGGTVTGLLGTVVLQNNATDDNIITADGTFTFNTPVAEGAGYAVTVKTHPDEQTCNVTSGTGTMGGANVANVSVTCTAKTYSIGGTLSGLDTGSSLEVILQNNGGDDLTLDTNGMFSFDTELEAGDAFAVTIDTQPNGQTCHVTSGTGIVSDDVATVTVYCAYFAYVSKYNTGEVAVIDTTDNSLFTTIENVGTNPYNFAITPDGSTVYVSNLGGGTVAIIDSATNTISDITMTGFNVTRGVALKADLSELYIASANDNKVYVCDLPRTVTGACEASVTGTFSYPVNLAITPDGSSVYVPNYTNHTVSVVQTSNNTVIATPAVGASPHDISISPDGNYVFATNNIGKTISVIRTSDNLVVKTLLSMGNAPQGSVVTPDNAYLYATTGNGVGLVGVNVVDITDADPNNWAICESISDASFIGPVGAAVTPDGNYVYIANSDGLSATEVTVIDTSTVCHPTEDPVVTSIDLGDMQMRIGIQQPNPN